MITWIETTIVSRRKNEKATMPVWVAPAQAATEAKAGKRKRANVSDVAGGD
jgi:hypothetical protein